MGTNRPYHPIKRVMDIAGSLALLSASWPAIAVAACLIKVTLGGPVFFVQLRAGQYGEPFPLFKLRTMKPQQAGDGPPLSDRERLTGLGVALRRLSVDELPQLMNILRGEMSLVGPRPLPTQYLSRYSAAQSRRHEVKPGLTGMAQVQRAGRIDWSTKLNLDVWYVDNLSLTTDLKILLKTLGVLVRDDGADEQEFQGASAAAPQSERDTTRPA